MEPAVEMLGIHKTYPDGTIALRGIDFSVARGEIHGLLGENGAGKTSLMNILYGLIKPTIGRTLVHGKEVRFRDPHDAITIGIGMVHQHFALVQSFTVMENIILGSEPTSHNLVIDYGEARKKIEDLSKKTGLSVNPDVRVETLPVGIKQRVEILKMLHRGADILILDEPTAVLSPVEVTDFFKILDGFRDQGKTVIFVTHKLKEALRICDRITVLRGGRVAGVVKTEETDPSLLARMMVGREVVLELEKLGEASDEKVFEVEDLWVNDDEGARAVKGISFAVRSGEVFGIAGVEGNGQMELVEAMTGLRRASRGRVMLKGRDVTNTSPSKLMRAGMAHIPEDRHGRGLILDFTVAENLMLGFQSSTPFVSRHVVDLSYVHRFAEEAMAKFGIVAADENVKVKHLSGGNQQRVILARELSRSPDVIVAAQPTRGLDVSATEFVRSILLRMRGEGKAVVLVSSDLDELYEMSDRIAVIYQGTFVGVKRPEELTRQEMGLLMGGVEA